MPDKPHDAGAPDEKDDALDAELAEFEAGLERAIGPIPPPRRVDRVLSEEPEESEIPPLPSDDEIEARLSRAIKDAESFMGPISVAGSESPEELEDAPMESPRRASRFDEVDAEFDEHIQKFDRRAKVSIQGRRKQESYRKSQSTQDGESAKGLGEGLTVAYVIIGFPLLGAGLGWLLSGGRDTQNWMALGVVIGMGLGMVFGIFLLNRFQSKK